jgi:hypothetical protein
MMASADRHDRAPISFRPRKEIEPWLYAHAEQTGQTPGTVLAEALAQYRKREEARARRERKAVAAS